MPAEWVVGKLEQIIAGQGKPRQMRVGNDPGVRVVGFFGMVLQAGLKSDIFNQASRRKTVL